MLNKIKIYELLDSRGIPYAVTEHEAVYNMAELSHVDLPYLEDVAKNLFVRDDKKRNYYLITVKGDKRVDLKAFRNTHGTRPLRLASAEDLAAMLKLDPGSVTPLGLLNDDDSRVSFYLDQEFLQGKGKIGCHPNDNTATVWMDSGDLIRMIEDHGNSVHIVDL